MQGHQEPTYALREIPRREQKGSELVNKSIGGKEKKRHVIFRASHKKYLLNIHPELGAMSKKGHTSSGHAKMFW